MKALSQRLEYSFKVDDNILGLGKIPWQLTTSDRTFIELKVDVVNAGIPLLIGLDILDEQKLVANNVEKFTQSRLYG